MHHLQLVQAVALAVLAASSLSKDVPSCFHPAPLPLGSLEAKCTVASFLGFLRCENAIDGNPSTMWMPNSARDSERPFFLLILNRKVTVSRIDLLLNNWGHGTASTIRLDFSNGVSHTVRLRQQQQQHPDQNPNGDSWRQIALPHQIQTDSIKVTVEALDGILFGGIKEMRVFGCNVKFNWDDTDSRAGKLTNYPNGRSNGYLKDASSDPLSLRSTDQQQTGMMYGSLAGAATGALFGLLVLGMAVYALVATRCCQDRRRMGGSGSSVSGSGNSVDEDELSMDQSLEDASAVDAEIMAAIRQSIEDLRGKRETERTSLRNEILSVIEELSEGRT